MAKKFPKHWPDIIRVQPMNFPVMVVRPSSLAMLLEHMEHHKCGKHFQAEVHDQIERVQSGGASFYFSDNNYILFLPDEWEDLNVFHEALHCAIRLWDDVGADLSLPENEEVLTYTQGHVVQLLKKHIYKIPEKKPCQSAKLKAATAGEAAEKSIRQKPRLRSRGGQSKPTNTKVNSHDV